MSTETKMWTWFKPQKGPNIPPVLAIGVTADSLPITVFTALCSSHLLHMIY